jgi:eukaryotic-like serine/threonine-protein kinase
METSKPVEKVSRYEITGELGKGAMGRVYKAVDPTIGRTVALKTMRLDVHGLETDEMLRRFKNEARLAGVLNHANIVTIYDAGEQDGLFYIAMEYIEGVTLHSVLNERKTLAPEEIINISKQVCAGLDHAHHHGVIHRDVKPANIMLEPDGVAKIMDFGIAKSGGGGVTSTGQVLGTPNYMAPEQVRGHVLDGRTDLFSFGVMLYEMTTGEKPFAGTNVTTIIYKIINESPTPPRELDVTIHPGLDKVIMKALAKKPDDRYQTGAELARDLQNYKSLGANTDSTQEIPSGSYPAPTGAAPAKAPAKPAAARAAAPAAVASSTPKPRRMMQPPGPSLTKIWTGVAIFVVLVALASVGIWKGEIARDHTPAVTAKALPVATPPVASVTPEPTPEPSTPVKGKSKRGAVAPAAPKKSEPKSVADQPSTQTSGTGDLKITSTPDGAALQIDGRGDPSMTTPYTALRLAPGPHDITFIKSGYLDDKKVISVTAGNTGFVSATLQKAPVATSQVTFNSDPGGAEIWVDGKSIGRVTPSQAVVVAGQHQIVLRKPGYEDSSNPVSLVAGQPFSLSNNLKPLAPASGGSPFGKFKKIFGGANSAEENVNVSINSTPAGAAISLNGKDLGQQTPFTLPLAPGKYNIGLTLAGHETVNKSIKVEKGKSAEINEALPAQ